MRARRTWDGYLIWGRWNDQLLRAALLEGYLAAADHIDEFRDEVRQQLCMHLAAVAISSEVNPLSWVHKFTAAVNVAHRVEWMNQVEWMVKELPPDAVERQWQRWMRQYWQDRLDSIPVQLTAEEATALATWAVYLTESVAEGVDLATARPAGFSEHTDALRDLDENRLHRAPAEFAKLIAHLMGGTLAPFWRCHELAKLCLHCATVRPSQISTTLSKRHYAWAALMQRSGDVDCRDQRPVPSEIGVSAAGSGRGHKRLA